ncbi:DUF4178 domain-containing protein [Bacteriovoracaceae bacterium]|nr:DUF4178 domain-containing protein [Bacteriovoracaceae bacterium]
MEWILLLGLSFAIFFGYEAWKKKSALPGGEKSLIGNKSQNFDKGELRIENVQKGGVIHLTGVGADMEDFDLTVLSKHTYREGEYSWYELEVDRGDKKMWLNYEEDDELLISIKINQLKLREIGLKKSDLDEIDEAEEGEFSYKGKKYFYEDSGTAIFYRHSLDDNAESFDYWEFETEKGDHLMSVESWGGEIEVTESIPLKATQLTIYSLQT